MSVYVATDSDAAGLSDLLAAAQPTTLEVTFSLDADGAVGFSKDAVHLLQQLWRQRLALCP
jgi:hypothetical protein